MIIFVHIAILMKIININIYLNFLNDKDFMFKLKSLNKLSIYMHIIDVNIINIFI